MKTTDTKKQIMNGNEAVAWVTYQMNEVFPIYPITPATPMSELVSEWQAMGIKNIWDEIPVVQPMQGEGGVAGALHGAIQTGALASTFTASQGLLLMIPNLYKIAGELTPTVVNVATRSIATHALSIYSDHSDVMAARTTGCALLNSASVQEAMDFAIIAQAASLRSRIPFIHFFDGFRTSHESTNVEVVPKDVIRAMVDEQHVQAHKQRALTPDNPFIRGTSQGSDAFFQSREATNKYYTACSQIVQQEMQKFELLTGRSYSLFEYEGHPQAEKVIVAMGAPVSTIAETAAALNRTGSKCGVLKVRLFRPFNTGAFLNALPPTCRQIAVLDKTKEPGATGEPLYLDVLQAFSEMMVKNNKATLPMILGGRYGLGSKELTLAMVKAVYDDMDVRRPKNHFTVGIEDDVTNSSLQVDEHWDMVSSPNITEILHIGYQDYGMKEAVDMAKHLHGEPFHFQEYTVKEAKKFKIRSEAHIRLSKDKFDMRYLIDAPDLAIVHDRDLEFYNDKIKKIKPNGTLLISTENGSQEMMEILASDTKEALMVKNVNVYTIDLKDIEEAAIDKNDFEPLSESQHVINESQASPIRKKDYEMLLYIMGIMVSGVMLFYRPFELVKSIEDLPMDMGNLQNLIKESVKKVDLGQFKQGLFFQQKPKTHEPQEISSSTTDLIHSLIRGNGHSLPVSAFPADGTYPSGTANLEKRNLATELPEWEKMLCTQCGSCAMVCPHAAIRIKVYNEELLVDAPVSFQSANDMNFNDHKLKYTVQIAPDDCTGCGVCVEACPSLDADQIELKALIMKPKENVAQKRESYDFFLSLPEFDRSRIDNTKVAQQQVQQPLFEFSGACAGCGETPYLKLISQLFGDRAIVANATGCSSIYGGYLPTTPWRKNNDHRGPAWSNSLYEDNAEFGLGFRLSVDRQRKEAERLLWEKASEVGAELVEEILSNSQNDDKSIVKARNSVAKLKRMLSSHHEANTERLLLLADYLVKKSVWIIGGDGWAYDIGFGGLDHVLASGENVNILVLDNEVYANTGGQMSKATPMGAKVKFAPAGKKHKKKDLMAIAKTYEHVYVASVALGADEGHTLRTFVEADRFDGPSLIVAYSHCIEQDIDMRKPLITHKEAVASGNWKLS